MGSEIDNLKSLKVSDQDELDALKSWQEQRYKQLHEIRESGRPKVLGSETLGSAWNWVRELPSDVALDLTEGNSHIDKDRERERLYKLQVQRAADMNRGYKADPAEDNRRYETGTWLSLGDGKYKQQK
jgi:hypothetical protein